ncbi:GGDEF domain-containing protein [Rhizobacter sp. LjRoot28]|uniref:GGDEF domain-containing protein n=1 Tax=Rhizobacter sp. LjRoot28 TaxID=3342309 RepID=UPI003ECFEFC7
MATLGIPRLSLAWLGPQTGAQRLRASQSLLAVVVYTAFALVQYAEVRAGLVDATASMLLTAFYMTGALGFHLVIRSGLNQRLSDDPSLTLPQMVLGVLAATGSYAITGPARGAVMSLMVMILVFGMFALRPRQARRLAVFACALLGATMVWKGWTEPARYPPEVEAVHLLFAVITLAAVATLTSRMAGLRQRLHQQKRELEHALEQIRLLARQDELTGLSNRRHMVELMAIEKARQRRTGQPLSVALLDIDWFKRINDTYGHGGGDLALKTFAQLTRDSLREVDVMGRWGGEEFLVILPDTTATEAAACVERMRGRLASLSADAIAPGLRVTFSGGVAELMPIEEVEAGVERADRAMYRAKVQGRNCTVVDGEGEGGVDAAAAEGAVDHVA